MVCIHLDFSRGIPVVNRYMDYPNKVSRQVVRWSLRNFWCVVKTCLRFGRGHGSLVGYVDSDYMLIPTKRRSPTSYVVNLTIMLLVGSQS